MVNNYECRLIYGWNITDMWFKLIKGEKYNPEIDINEYLGEHEALDPYRDDIEKIPIILQISRDEFIEPIPTRPDIDTSEKFILGILLFAHELTDINGIKIPDYVFDRNRWDKKLDSFLSKKFKDLNTKPLKNLPRDYWSVGNIC